MSATVMCVRVVGSLVVVGVQRWRLRAVKPVGAVPQAFLGDGVVVVHRAVFVAFSHPLGAGGLCVQARGKKSMGTKCRGGGVSAHCDGTDANLRHTAYVTCSTLLLMSADMSGLGDDVVTDGNSTSAFAFKPRCEPPAPAPAEAPNASLFRALRLSRR